jgi:outer membrane biosynthesis protein TonB
MGHDTHHPLHPVTERLQQGGDVTKDELHALRLTLGTMPAVDQKNLRDAIDGYVEKKKTMLAKNIETDGALLALRQALTQKENTERGPAETLGRNAGTTIGQVGDTLMQDAQSLSYAQWKALKNPKSSTTETVVRVLGIAAAGYGLYRAAKWALGKPKDSFWGKAFKILGVTAAAGFLLHSLTPTQAQAETTTPKPTVVPPAPEKKPATPKEDPKPTSAPTEPAKKPEPKTVKSPVAAPAAVKKTKPETKNEGILQSIPDNLNLVGGKFVPFTMKGKNHTIKVTSDSMFIDSKKFQISAVGAGPFGGNVSLSIHEAKRTGSTFMFRAGAYGKEGTVSAGEADLEAILEKLLSGRTYETKTKEGQRIEISSSNY